MAKKEPNKPEEVKTDLATETPTEETKQLEQLLEAGGEHTPPEVAAGEPTAQDQEAGATLSDKGGEQPAPFDISGKHRPGDEVVVSFDKINEIVWRKRWRQRRSVKQHILISTKQHIFVSFKSKTAAEALL